MELSIIDKVKLIAGITDSENDALITLYISIMTQRVKSYCNIDELCEDLENFIASKVARMITYQLDEGGSGAQDVKSITEGDVSVSYGSDDNNGYYGINSLNDSDKKILSLYRCLK